MRLTNIYKICKANQPILQSITKANRKALANRQNEFTFENWKDIEKSIFAIYEIECLNKVTKDIIDYIPASFFIGGVIRFDESWFGNFYSKVLILLRKMETIIDLVESKEKVDDETNSLDVNIPDNIELSKLGKIIGDLNIVLTQCPTIEIEANSSRVIRTDSGSIWLVISGTALFLMGVGYLLNCVNKYRADLITIDQQKIQYDNMVEKNKVLNGTVEVFEALKQIALDDCVKDVVEKSGKDLNHEEVSKVKKSVEKMSMIIETGTKLYASIDTSEKIQELFPNREIKLIESFFPKLIGQDDDK